jgi:UDP-N-acetylmuramoyl-tripeptide--D-alanyl-D-alanine ligase
MYRLLEKEYEKMTLEQLFERKYYFQIDSRKIKKNDVFVALKGENTDGHRYVEDAFKKGASFAVVEAGYPDNSEKIIKVPNVQEKLLSVSSKIVNQNAKMKIGITGSTGKTTTKVCLKNIIESNISTFATEKNYNTEIGIPISILNNYSNEEVAIIEMGIQKKGDMENLTKFFNLDVAFITNIGTSHLEFLKSKEGIAEEKSKIITALNGGLLVYNSDSIELQKFVKSYKNKISFGQKVNSDAYLIDYEYFEDTTKVHFKTFGKDGLLTLKSYWSKGQILDLLAAVTFSIFTKIPIDPFVISEIKLPESRFELIKNENNIIINDSYNASEESFFSAFESVEKIQATSKILIMSEIKEIGQDDKIVLNRVIEKAKEIFDEIYFYDKEDKYSFDDVIKIKEIKKIEKILNSSKGVILIKGSNSTGLYKFMQERG